MARTAATIAVDIFAVMPHPNISLDFIHTAT
jgi:hypothetical protein